MKKIILTERQAEWLREHFPDTSNRECAEKLGISRYTMKRIIREMGLSKSREYIHDNKVKAGKASARAQEGTGKGTGRHRLRNRLPHPLQEGNATD